VGRGPSLLSYPKTWNFLDSVSVRVNITVVKHHDQKQISGKGLRLPHHCPSSKKVKTGIQTEQKPGGRS
jgi:ribosomal protein L1